MAHESHLYDAADTELYKTDGYGGSHADVDNTERFTDDIDQTVNMGSGIDFKFDGSGATDNLLLSLYERRDEDWDGSEIAVWNDTIESDGSEHIYHFTIDESYGAGRFRFGMKSSGSTDTFEMDVEMRQWRPTATIA